MRKQYLYDRDGTGERETTDITVTRPEQPFLVIFRPGIRDLEPVAVAAISRDVVVGRAGEVDLHGALVPEYPVGPAAVPRDAEPDLRPGQNIRRLGGGCRCEGFTSARDVGAVDVCLRRYLGIVAPLGVVPWSVGVLGRHVANLHVSSSRA